MSEKTAKFWHATQGVFGILLVASAVGWIGYVIRGYEDGGIVASLMERIHNARIDERDTQLHAQEQMRKGYELRASERDEQVKFLIGQNKILINLFVTSSKERKAQLEQLKELAYQSASAATQAKSTAAATEHKADEVSKKVDKIASAVDAASAPKTTLHIPFLKGH